MRFVSKSAKPTFDYRAARDRVYGMVRSKTGRVIGYREPPTTIAERSLLLALIEFAPNMEPSIAALCKMLPADARRVRRLIESCQEKGRLKVIYRKGRRNRYALLDPLPTDPPHPLPTDPPKQTSKAVGVTLESDLDPEYLEKVLLASRLGSAMLKPDRKPEDDPYGGKVY